jgi:hypothetical protein
VRPPRASSSPRWRRPALSSRQFDGVHDQSAVITRGRHVRPLSASAGRPNRETRNGVENPTRRDWT